MSSQNAWPIASGVGRALDAGALVAAWCLGAVIASRIFVRAAPWSDREGEPAVGPAVAVVVAR